MAIGEAGVDYLMFGEPRADGSVPTLDLVEERAAWWAEIFDTPRVAFAPALDAVRRLAATGAEFVALGDAVWSDLPLAWEPRSAPPSRRSPLPAEGSR